ncbi:sigma-70 family RNA polymerase sigma factor [Virgibacillus salexigens]|uniref:RNA polymerase factor sigma-70 n=1 Tax=Virgibacillus massiliensis TaxID=1462526 RepID=A0A024Q8G2_9BACI|nr:sigma-70 family RNA polymerase sigma factor [Virgibacillus massiliensis]CDQ38794.1 RNA polymerase factor sigma-70 [Virgibacillus massiliensis]
MKQPNTFDLTFEEVLAQNERRIHYHIHRLKIRDPHQEFFQEGLVAMWNAYETYHADKGPLATYFNYAIRNRMIDLIRKQTKERENVKAYIEQQKIKTMTGNYYQKGTSNYSVKQMESVHFDEKIFLSEAKKVLTEKQWKWLNLFAVQNLTMKEIAEMEGVSIDAVKSWGREARKKLRTSESLDVGDNRF